MIFCFSGTGNSRYIARRFAEALQDTIIDLNAKMKAQDNSLIQTGQDVIIVVPTYAWRIPRVVSEWFAKTQLASAERIWFVMDCGEEIGNAAKYNRQLAAQLSLTYMGTAQIIMPENYIAMFGAPEADSFYASEACIGCGQCASRCPMNNIQIQNGKPRYHFEDLKIHQ